MSHRPFIGLCAFLLTASAGFAQAPKADPDVLIFTNGDKLVGHLESAAGGSVTFKSDMIGEIKVDWAKIKELHAAGKFAVIPKGVKVVHKNESPIPQGTVAMADQKLEVGSTPPQTLPVGNVANVVPEADFEKAVNDNHNILHDWTGAITAGASLVQATQDSRTFTGAVNLIRAVPTENWLNPRSRTLLDFTASYGTVSQPGSPTLKTEIYHADAERDEYFSPRAFGFGQADFDHNFSQGLDLQQTYSGGIGWSVLKTANQTLDLKASMSYINQQFSPSMTAATLNQSLIGSTFGEAYMRKVMHGIVFTQKLAATPAWNNTNAYSGIASAGLALPAYKRLSVSLNATDAFINDPPVGFKKNSFQYTLGLTYSLK